MGKITRALISVSDKTGVAELAKALSARGVDILSTGGTAAELKKAGIPVVEVADYTGSPEILGGRVKTLHPKIHGGILGRRSDSKHRAELGANDIGSIDMVVVNLYPFEATAARPDCPFEDAVENIDIGGPSMLRSAAKNHEDVAAVTDPADYRSIMEEMEANGGALTAETKFRLAKKAFAATARYDCAIINYLTRFDDSKKPLDWPTSAGFTFEQAQQLRYGENPHQRAAFYRDAAATLEPSLASARQIQGKELSYNNIMDADAAIAAVRDLSDKPFAAVIVKHANPCGAAVSDKSLAGAYAKAFACDPTSAFGGIIALDRTVDRKAASAIVETFYEVIAAPGFDAGALAVLSQKKNLRLLEVPGLDRPFKVHGFSFRKVVGGLLLQERDSSCEDIRKSKVVTRRAPSETEWDGLEFAWRICKHVKSNAIVYAAADRTLGIGAGQTSRVDSSKIAAMKMQSMLGPRSHESKAERRAIAVASDAFFPFRDGIDEAARAGATAIVQPGGSVRDEEVIEVADKHGMAMIFTGVRHFRH
ncbi:MAG: bifunctional phosphoribosylaminoimidazolecarboxamide formyltransferase/IMP cyclohydrolase [Pseudomonadota bacterium]